MRYCGEHQEEMFLIFIIGDCILDGGNFGVSFISDNFKEVDRIFSWG